MPKQYCVGAVEKAIKILNFLAEHPDSSFSEIFTALSSVPFDVKIQEGKKPAN